MNDGGYYLYLHGDLRPVSGTAVGDRVQAEISLDTNYKNGPMHAMPPRTGYAKLRAVLEG